MAVGDLTTLAKARDFLQKPGGDTVQDTVITDTISRASRVIQRKIRVVAPAETAVAKDFPYDGQGWLDLSPFYARTVTAVSSVNSAGATTALTGGDWTLRFVHPADGPTSPEDGVYTHLRAPKLILPRLAVSSGVGSLPVSTSTSRPDPIPGYGAYSVYDPATSDDYEALQTVTVTGNWGYTAVPVDVEQACLIAVKVWLSNYVSAFSRVFNEDTGRTTTPSELPETAEAMLKPYLRTGPADA